MVLKKISFCLMIGTTVFFAPSIFGADHKIDSSNQIVINPPNSSLKVSIKTATQSEWTISNITHKRIQKTKEVPQAFVVQSTNDEHPWEMILPLFSHTIHDHAMKETIITDTSSFQHEGVSYVITKKEITPYILHKTEPLQYKYSKTGKPHTINDGFARSIALDKAACKKAFQNGQIYQYLAEQSMIPISVVDIDTDLTRQDDTNPISGYFYASPQQHFKLIHHRDPHWVTHLDLSDRIRVKKQDNHLKTMNFMKLLAVETLGKTYVFFTKKSVPYRDCRFTISKEITENPSVYDEIHTPTYRADNVNKDILVPEEAVRIRVQEKPSFTTKKTGILQAREILPTPWHYHTTEKTISYSYYCQCEQALITTPKTAIYPDGHEKHYKTTTSVYTIWDTGNLYNSDHSDIHWLYEVDRPLYSGEDDFFKKSSGENRIVIDQRIAKNILALENTEDSDSDSESQESGSGNEGSGSEGSDSESEESGSGNEGSGSEGSEDSNSDSEKNPSGDDGHS